MVTHRRAKTLNDRENTRRDRPLSPISRIALIGCHLFAVFSKATFTSSPVERAESPQQESSRIGNILGNCEIQIILLACDNSAAIFQLDFLYHQQSPERQSNQAFLTVLNLSISQTQTLTKAKTKPNQTKRPAYGIPPSVSNHHLES